MADLEHVRILRSGVENWNKWRTDNPNIKPDLNNADLRNLNLDEADLRGADLGLADIRETSLKKANFSKAYLANVRGENSDLRNATFTEAILHSATFDGAYIFKADFKSADLRQADFIKSVLDSSMFSYTPLTNANFSDAMLRNVHFIDCFSLGAKFSKADLTGASFADCDLSYVDFNETDLTSVKLVNTVLNGVNAVGANFTDAKINNQLGVGPVLIDVNWRDVKLGVLDDEFFEMKILGDEAIADDKWDLDLPDKKIGKTSEERKTEYKNAARANRQLKMVLAEHGMDREAAKFAFRGQITNRKYLWFSILVERSWGKKSKLITQWLFSFFLFLLAGYGYKVGRAFLTYLIVIFGFGLIFWVGAGGDPIDSFVESVNVFHGRGISTDSQMLIAQNKFLLLVAAFEATIGLIIEVTFIAALTQRVFGK